MNVTDDIQDDNKTNINVTDDIQDDNKTNIKNNIKIIKLPLNNCLVIKDDTNCKCQSESFLDYFGEYSSSIEFIDKEWERHLSLLEPLQHLHWVALNECDLSYFISTSIDEKRIVCDSDVEKIDDGRGSIQKFIKDTDKDKIKSMLHCNSKNYVGECIIGNIESDLDSAKVKKYFSNRAIGFTIELNNSLCCISFPISMYKNTESEIRLKDGQCIQSRKVFVDSRCLNGCSDDEFKSPGDDLNEILKYEDANSEEGKTIEFKEMLKSTVNNKIIIEQHFCYAWQDEKGNFKYDVTKYDFTLNIFYDKDKNPQFFDNNLLNKKFCVFQKIQPESLKETPSPTYYELSKEENYLLPSVNSKSAKHLININCHKIIEQIDVVVPFEGIKFIRISFCISGKISFDEVKSIDFISKDCDAKEDEKDNAIDDKHSIDLYENDTMFSHDDENLLSETDVDKSNEVSNPVVDFGTQLTVDAENANVASVGKELTVDAENVAFVGMELTVDAENVAFVGTELTVDAENANVASVGKELTVDAENVAFVGTQLLFVAAESAVHSSKYI